MKEKVYLAWKSNCADVYDHTVNLLGVYATRKLADARVASEPPGYEINYYVTEEEVLEQ